MSGQRVIITGANSGLGKETATRIAAAGATVIMAVRNTTKGQAAAADIRAVVPAARLEIQAVDLADLASVHAFAEALTADARGVDVLINNAGAAPRKRSQTVDGFESCFGANFLGPFALTNRLLPILLDAPAPRVATMTSGVAAVCHINFDDLEGQHRYNNILAYSRSKLANMLMAQHLARVAAERNWPLLSTYAHPGYVRTNLQSAESRRDDPPPPGRFGHDVSQGAQAMLIAATSPRAIQGGYYRPGGPMGVMGHAIQVRPPRTSRRPDTAQTLWATAEYLTGTYLPPTTLDEGFDRTFCHDDARSFDPAPISGDGAEHGQ